MDLFINKGAEFSECRRYRYALWRIWDDSMPKVMFIGLNPSKANETTDDPTIRRVHRFAIEWGYGGFYMLNLYAWVTPYPGELLNCEDPVGNNDEWIEKIAGKCDKVIFAWGSGEMAESRASIMAEKLDGFVLKHNKNGSPRHPLYVPSGTKPVKF